MTDQNQQPDIELVLEKLKSDKRFIYILESETGKPLEKALIEKDDTVIVFLNRKKETCFILKNDVFNWLVSLNVRLIKSRIFRISRIHLLNSMKLLCQKNEIDNFPSEIISFGHRYGLIGYDFDHTFHFFPLARFLSLINIPSDLYIKLLKELDFKELSAQNQENNIDQLIHEGFSLYQPDVINIVKQRLGFNSAKGLTLRQIARERNFSAEGIRRIENKFWNGISDYPEKYLTPFLKAFLLTVINRSGSQIQYIDGVKEFKFKFLCKCVSLKYVELPKMGIIVPLHPKTDLEPLLSKRNNMRIDFDEIVEDVINYFYYSFSFEDIIDITKRIQKFRIDNLKSTHRVYQTLKKIGKPAHYSEVAEMHNLIFPDYSTSNNNIHSYLAREEFGVVYIGRKGTFALAEWGYEKPKMKLYDQVVEIVSNIYKKTQKPVAFNTICAEIGKFRKLMNLNSFKYAVYWNPGLQKVEKDKFVLKKKDFEISSYINLEKMENAFSFFLKESEKEQIKIEAVHSFNAIWKCEKCNNMESNIFVKKNFVFLRCIKCHFERKYPPGIWGVHTNIQCPKCRNDFVVGFHPKFGPYLKCKKCGFWDKIRGYLIEHKIY